MGRNFIGQLYLFYASYSACAKAGPQGTPSSLIMTPFWLLTSVCTGLSEPLRALFHASKLNRPTRGRLVRTD